MNKSLQSLKGEIEDSRNGINDRPIASNTREYVATATGTFESWQVERFLQLSTTNDKKACLAELGRLCNRGILERVDGRNGIYRPVDKSLEKMDLSHISSTVFDLWLPFGLHEYVRIFPKNIIMIAGEKDAGKTGVLLNVVESNMNKHRVHYFNSEMGPEELVDRLEQFDIGKEGFVDNPNFIPYERSQNFADAIVQAKAQNDIILVDFLELGDNFFLVAKEVKAIFDKLDKGVALIAIQKDEKKEWGRGAGFSNEKARLYVNLLEGGLAKIKVAKAFYRDKGNPRGKITNYKLVDGCKLSHDGWHYQSDEEDAGVTKTYWGSK